MADTHASPNYMAIFLWLFILTVTEIAVIYLPVAKVVIVILLVGLAISKASLVAMYFMHLRFERLTMGLIAVTPVLIGALLIFLLIPDSVAVSHKTADSVKPAAIEKR
jgi:cytochrome c oxidase subunit 4